MIRILHTADWHLGQTFFGYDRAEEHKAFLDWLAEEIRQNEIDALVIAGDVFDVSNPSAASQSLYYEFIYRVTAENPRLQIVIVAGNHDSAARLEAPLPLLQAMRTEVRGVVRKLEGGEIDYDHLTIELKNREGEAEVLCMAVPFLRQGDYPVVETEGNPYMEGVRELYARLLQRLWARRETNQAILAVGHLQATGSEIAEKDYSERTVIGGLECVSPDTFSEKIAYTALGHIHRPQSLSEKVRYCGSPLKYSFSEAKYDKTVTIVDADDFSVQTIPLKPLHDMRMIKGSIENILSKEVINAADSDDYLHITLTDKDNIIDAMDKVRSAYPNVMQLEFERDMKGNTKGVYEATGVGTKPDNELFYDFYKLQNGVEIDSEKAELVDSILEEVKEN